MKLITVICCDSNTMCHWQRTFKTHANKPWDAGHFTLISMCHTWHMCSRWHSWHLDVGTTDIEHLSHRGVVLLHVGVMMQITCQPGAGGNRTSDWLRRYGPDDFNLFELSTFCYDNFSTQPHESDKCADRRTACGDASSRLLTRGIRAETWRSEHSQYSMHHHYRVYHGASILAS
jgi:hypothetical protein